MLIAPELFIVSEEPLISIVFYSSARKKGSFFGVGVKFFGNNQNAPCGPVQFLPFYS